MKLEDFKRHEWHYSVEENGMETRAVAMFCDGLAAVLQVVKDDDGRFYYGVFANYCDEQTLEDRETFLRFLNDNETNGYSTGSFDTFAELLEDMQKENVTGYGVIKEF